jgi:ABC-type Fe3+ transport system substrate-binding protein
MLFAKFTTTRESELAPDLKSDYGVGDLDFGISVNYNPSKIAPADVPTSFAQLADAKYNGKICMGNTYIEQEWVGALVQKYGEAMVKSVAKNTRTQNTSPRAVADLVISGECPIELGGVSAHAALGKPTQIKWLPLDPIVGEPRVMSISKDTKAPYEAALFVDWVESQDGGQAVNKSFGYGSPFAGQPIVFLDYLPADFGSRQITYSTSKSLIGSYPTYKAALTAWAKIVQTDFIAK